MKPVPISQHLPPSVRNALVDASRIHPTEPVSRQRIYAIDMAAASARRMYPHLFKKIEHMPAR